MNNTQSAPKIKRESKNKIRVEFERTPLKERLKARFLSLYFLKNVIWYLFRLVLLLGISYIILFPFFSKISGSFMAMEDFVDVTVRLIPKHFTLDIYKAVIVENGYARAFVNTLLLSTTTALIQTFICTLIGYGFAKFKFKGSKILFLCVILTMIIPHDTIKLSMYMNFRYFDILGLFNLLGKAGVMSKGYLELNNTYWPFYILSLGGLAFKNGLYIFMMRQFFKGVPDELEESAYVDGSGVFRTFIQVIIPLSIPMMITVFLFAFSWSWTDDFYSNLFFSAQRQQLIPSIVAIPRSLTTQYAGQNLWYAAIRNTCGILILAPLLVMYLFCQRYLIQGIERSGIVG